MFLLRSPLVSSTPPHVPLLEIPSYLFLFYLFRRKIFFYIVSASLVDAFLSVLIWRSSLSDPENPDSVFKERKFADLIKNNQWAGCVSRAAVRSHCNSLASEYASATPWLKGKDK
ncbi:hypothetical protein F2Q70_00039700 [Brassica cretica]|uniref:Uncharacterized protein n=1 Tax=Brassica cretica TaxID=69181 RepID=A0A8S9KCB3_BRACR|nr:hypothetical protein F2Q70_00039700 [Brassica cretica]